MTHVTCNCIDGNKEIVRVKDYRAISNQIIMSENSGRDGRSSSMTADDGLTTFFTYRFINFEWKELQNEFVPIKFNCERPFDELRKTYLNEDRLSS